MTIKRVLLGLIIILVAFVVAGYAILAQFDVERLRGIIEAEAKSATGRKLQIDGPIDLNISLTPSIAVQDVKFANAKWGSAPQMVQLKEFEVEVEILPLFTGDIKVDRLIFIEPQILLEINKKGRANWDFRDKSAGQEEATDEAESEPAPPASDQELVLPTVNQFAIKGGSITFRDGQSGQEINLALDDVEATIDGKTGGLTVDLAGAYNGSPIAMNANIGSLSALASGEISSLKAAVQAGGADLSVDGTVANQSTGPTFDLQISVAGKSLGDLSELAGTAVPPLGPYDLKSNVVGRGQVYSLNGLALTMGGSDLSGNAELSLSGERPSLKAGFVSKVLKLEDFAAESKGGKKEKAKKDDQPASEAPDSKFVFTKDPLPLDGLKAADAEIKVTAGEVHLDKKLRLNDLSISLSLANGHLIINPASTVFASGKIDGGVDVNAALERPKMAFDVIASGIDYGQLLKDMEIDDTVSGKINLDIALAGTGSSMRQVASSLSGHTSIVTQKGQINNRILKLLAVGLDNVLGPLLSGQNDAQLHCAVSRFEINKGQAKSKVFLVDSEVLTVIGSGDINLKKETLDLSFDTATSEASLASLAIPFNVTGTLKSPKVAPDPLGTASKAAKALEGLSDGEGLLGDLSNLADSSLSGGQKAQSGEGLCQQALSGKKAKKKSKTGKKSKKKSDSAADDVLKGAEQELKNTLGLD